MKRLASARRASSKTPDGFVVMFQYRRIEEAATPPRAFGTTRALAAENAWAEFERLREAGPV